MISIEKRKEATKSFGGGAPPFHMIAQISPDAACFFYEYIKFSLTILFIDLKLLSAELSITDNHLVPR